jgi:hypothetical protein
MSVIGSLEKVQPPRLDSVAGLDETVAALPFGSADNLSDPHPEDVAVEADRRVQIRGHKRHMVKATPQRDRVGKIGAFESHGISLVLEQRFVNYYISRLMTWVKHCPPSTLLAGCRGRERAGG